jgi:poly(3-hydroxybutyrate) depolymerase
MRRAQEEDPGMTRKTPSDGGRCAWGASRRTRAAAAFAMLVVAACSRGDEDAPADARLAAHPIDPASVTVSGISSGGAMATQFHIAHSELVQGAAVLAAGPYYCAEGSVGEALGRCMKGEPAIPTAQLLEQAGRYAGEGRIDPLAGLAGDRVWIYNAAADPHVLSPVVDATQAFYVALAGPEHVLRLSQPGASHTFPTADPGAASCGAVESPFIGNCGVDGARTLLGHLYGELVANAAPRDGGLHEFDQRPYAALSGSASLAASGWVYVPQGCGPGEAGGCRLHVAFHGCQQGGSFVGDAFVRRAGFLAVAEANRIVVLFPQAEKSLEPLNPLGCWDWWGYEGADYATRDGRQVRAVRAMVADLLGEPQAAP